MNEPIATSLVRIEEADLPHATERVAVRLLTRAEWTPSGNGHLVMSWEAYCLLCHRTSRESARRHLTALANARLIHYSSLDEDIHVTWLGTGCTPRAAGRDTVAGASGDDERRTNQEHRAEDPTSREGDRALGGGHTSVTVGSSQGVRCSAPTVSHARANGGGGEILSYPREDGSTTTNHGPEVSDWLHELGLRPRTVHVHTTLGPDDVGRIIDAWEKEATRGEVGVGALLFRLRNGVTPVDMAAVRARAPDRFEIPEEYRDIIIG